MTDITGHWQFTKEFDINQWFGFIYRITNLTNNKEYIGKKQFLSHRTKIIKGKKNKKHYTKESNWKVYTGSSKHLNLDIETIGKDKFKFEIISLHATRASLFYAEVRRHVFEDVLRAKMSSGERKYYNGIISSTKFLPPDETPEELEMNSICSSDNIP